MNNIKYPGLEIKRLEKVKIASDCEKKAGLTGS